MNLNIDNCMVDIGLFQKKTKQEGLRAHVFEKPL